MPNISPFKPDSAVTSVNLHSPSLRNKAAGAVGRSRYTRFSSGGGSQLAGFSGGADGRYRIAQLMLETAYQHRGFSWQQELHVKDVADRLDGGESRTLWGGYAQAGYFFHGIARWVPCPLECAARYALIDPDSDTGSDFQHEFTFALNWFIRGHRNKLTADVSYLDFEDPTLGQADEWRFRLQWELSL